MDFFYVLELVLSAIRLYRADILELPASEWSLSLKMEGAIWITVVLLILVALVTTPTQPLATVRKPREGEVPRTPSAELSSSFYSQIAFSWINPLVYLGLKKPLQSADLPDLEPTDLSQHTVNKFKRLHKQTKFIRAALTAVRRDIIIQFCWGVPYSMLAVASPYCLNKIIKYIECKDCGPPTFNNYLWVFALFMVTILESAAQQQALHRGRRLYIHLVSICNEQVFAKALRRKDTASPDKNADKNADKKEKADSDVNKKKRGLNVSNLVGVDIEALQQIFCYMYELYSIPIQFSLGAYQLYLLLGRAAFIGIGFMIITLPVPAFLYATIGKLFAAVMENKDDRMDYLTEMLSAIRIVKFFGWESKFVEKINNAREKELKQIRKTYVRMCFAGIAWQIIPLLNTVVFFLVYTKLYGNEISASILFTTLSLINIMRMSLNTLPWAIRHATKASVSMKRIAKFVEEEEELIRDTTVTRLDGKARTHSESYPLIGFVNASFTWPNKEQDNVSEEVTEKKSWLQKLKSKFSRNPEPVAGPASAPEAVQERFKLKGISADFPVGQLSLIVGPTGSGKSALLLALLGELDRLEGKTYLPRLDYDETHTRGRGSGIAYVAQTAWLQNSTIRDNILFGKEFDEVRYNAVIEGCALVTDFDILEAGDATEIGEQGITLSGGQKQRVSLARAIYSDAAVLLLDDCLSAVDTHTGKQLFQTLTGPLMEGRTILMVTHQVQLSLSAASYVVVLDNGEVVGTGTPEIVLRNKWIENVTLATPVADDSSEVSTLDDEGAARNIKKPEKKASKLIEDEKKVEGSVSWSVYKIYLTASGGWFFWISILAFLIVRELISISQNGWLAIWANKAAEDTGAFVIMAIRRITPEPIIQSVYSAFTPKGGNLSDDVTMKVAGPDNVVYYLGVYILLSLATAIFYSLAEFYALVVGNIRGSRVIHKDLLYKVSRAKVRFFDTTPIGRIINRFSTDIATIDEQVLRGLESFLGYAIALLGIIFIISVNTPLFLVAAVFIVAIYVVLGYIYVPVSRDLKRLNSISKSPILNHFNESLNGVATIRAYGFEKRFQTRNLVNLDDNNRTFFLLWATNRWLHWRVDITGALVSFSAGMLVLRNWESIAPGWAALSLSYSLMFTLNIVWIIRVYAENEMNMNAVERVSEYMDIEEEPPAIIEGSRPPASWPHSGEITINHLTVRYAPDTPDVLKDVSVKIKAGEKVGVVGRTGSGKSTFAISLFRFMDPTSGSICIDGIDISKIGLQDLRSNLTIIPQDPILFKGTLRSNLDPFGEREDQELWEALRRSHLIPVEAAKRQGTEALISDRDTANPSSSSQSPAPSVKGSQSDTDVIVDPSKITLDTSVKENGSNFSQGQRQLIALARALVRQPKIIIMDEATASVDFETDIKIQNTIREEMADATMVTIAHRIRTIADFDRVLVLDQGKVVEYDKPYTLMRKEGGIFKSMCERSTEFDALLAIAEEKEKRDAHRLRQ
ncbi:P-loop containing nucleoside triphosphate hydrolase protein [Lobosporangium transversale]|uniref:p-loop containing nucleoside triphosphate hydrolase protein n=1 Tax=Lobosporangium transversale TaxID=64571 RepID=A0A1Y2GBJ4_9FUNG|nr:P-loop containing nucleoside triphosphate hydrolase protein [Lobosporangium transversale]ORZ00014.1 P-loop containing nucleoside triphosphate hydrolase protein [Lobosporangium transversale]|eukprot:XP_021876055.1 P-loop containing nucleoside triphosphate hydrolase protein [Lobosporangium transversale]